MAAADGAARHELLDAALALVREVRASLDELPGLTVMDSQFVGPGKAHEIDPMKVVVDLAELGISGYQAVDWLREHRHVNLAMADHRRMSSALTYADSRETVDPLLAAGPRGGPRRRRDDHAVPARRPRRAARRADHPAGRGIRPQRPPGGHGDPGRGRPEAHTFKVHAG